MRNLKFSGRIGEAYIYKHKGLVIVETEDLMDSLERLEEEFGTSKMPLGKYRHISVSLIDRLPTWEELSFVKQELIGDVFAFQMLPPKSHYVNVHKYCLHLWCFINS